MKKILLDTNFLMIPASLKVDIFSEIRRIADFSYEICVLDKTIEELKAIIERHKGRHGEAAKLALQLISKKNVKIIKTESIKNVDEIILETANSKLFIVATQDSALKRKLKENHIPILVLRQKKYLKIEG
jgi:rRNA-processing protein FCF1